MGRKQFERVTVVASYPGKRTYFIDDNHGAFLGIAYGSPLIMDIYPNDKLICMTDFISIKFAAFGTGLVIKDVSILMNNRKIGAVFGQGKNNVDLLYRYGRFEGADLKYPEDPAASYMAQKEIMFDDLNPLTIQYRLNSSQEIPPAGLEMRLSMRYTGERVL